MGNKADAMIRDLGANLAESIGVREGEDVAPESSPRPQPPPGPYGCLDAPKGVGIMS